MQAIEDMFSKTVAWSGLSQFILFGALAAVIGCSLLAERFQVEGSAMEPTLRPGTTVTAHKADQYKRGDIIVFESPADRQRIFLKRIVGMPGETLEIKEGKVFINGEPLNEPYVLELTNSTTLATFVPANNFYVLGDNRDHSNDSRHWGMVPREYIRGVVRDNPKGVSTTGG